ncbi:MAG TPA: VTT domain-containing protein [Candidatus Eisenbacteria bacterium]|nr:VTT domain-containing protein [Candidatus Eisenbacteria bacterium]
MKHLLAKWSHWILAVLTPLGVWGIMGFAFVDAAFFGMPLDPIVAGYAYAAPRRFLLLSVLAAIGSALGSIVIYSIGYKGGEVLLVKRMGQARFNKIQASFERHEFLALMLPSMLPPPTPFKLFVLAAGVAEMRFSHFLAAIFFGRFLRFSLESVLVIYFGPEIVGFFGSVIHHHARLGIAVVAVLALVGWWIWRVRKQNGAGNSNSPASA